MKDYADRVIRDLSNAGRVVALDIETNTVGTPFRYPNDTESKHPVGLDPRVSNVTTIALAGDGFAFQVDGGKADESLMLCSLLECMKYMWTSAVVGWNSTYFDVPFMNVRAQGKMKAEFSVDHRNYGYGPKYGPSEWFSLVANYDWDHARVGPTIVWDIAPLFRKWCEKAGVKHSLKPVAKHFGIDMVEVDASKMEALTPEERRAYNLSDANGNAKLGKLLPGLDEVLATL